MDFNLAVLAGVISSVVFVCSILPMLVKAMRTRDLTSYSLGNLLLANLGNVVHSIYVFSLPIGPIWALHSFYLLTSSFMLAMYLRHRESPPREEPAHELSTDAASEDGPGDDALGHDDRALTGRPDSELQPAGVL